MTLKYCPSCKRNVELESGINWILALILLILAIIPGLLYIIIAAIASKKRCPICGMKEPMMEPPKFDGKDNS